ncbi:MAG: hypothetical protein AAFV62_04715 [Pseudomonadota bacterium]
MVDSGDSKDDGERGSRGESGGRAKALGRAATPADAMTREQRLAQSLRDNLARRKARQRAAKATGSDEPQDGDGTTGGGAHGLAAGGRSHSAHRPIPGVSLLGRAQVLPRRL